MLLAVGVTEDYKWRKTMHNIGSGVNSNNDIARELSGVSFIKKLKSVSRFGAQSKHRKLYLEKYQWSITWSEYKKKHGRKKL